MIAYYIDDSFFGNSEFSKNMLYKLEVLLKESQAKKLLISSSRDCNKEIASFSNRLKEYEIEILQSTQSLEIDSVSMILSNGMLRFNKEEIRCFAGTVVEIDTENFEYHRIYLDLFPNEETDLISLLEEEIDAYLSNGQEKLKS